jgi:hypothetical protein
MLIQRQRLSASRIYETKIPVKSGEKKIYWVELSSAKGSGGLTYGKRVLYGVEINAKGNVISKLGGLTLERTTEKGTSNLITQIVRETKGKKGFFISPTEEKKLYAYAEEITPKGTKRLAKNIQATISESRTEYLGSKDVLGSLKEEFTKKQSLFFETKEIMKPVGGTKSISKEITLLEKPSLTISKQKVGKGNILTMKSEQKGISVGIQDELKKQSFTIKREMKPFVEDISKTSQVTKQTTKQIIKQELGRVSGFAQEFAKTITKPVNIAVSKTREGVKSIFKGTSGLKSKELPETKIKTEEIEQVKQEVQLRNMQIAKPRLDLFIGGGQEQQPVQKTKEIQKEEVKQLSKQLQEVIQIQKQKQLQKQVQKQIQILKQQPKTKTPYKPTTTLIPLTSGLGNALKKVRESPELVEAFGIRFGKEISLGKGTKEQASEKLGKFLFGTLGASGLLKKSTGEKLKAEETGLLRNFGYRKSKVSPYLVVEKKERRLKRGTMEIGEIQYFKKKSKKNLF